MSQPSIITQFPAPPAPGKKRLLVVDNEPASTRLVRLMLERHTGFDVCEVNEPGQAVASALSFQPDLILLDIEMPGMDGGRVAEQLSGQPSLRGTPIIFMTSLVTEDEAFHPMFTGGARVLAKPVTVSKLLQTVALLLRAALGERPPSALSGRAVSLRPDHPPLRIP